MSYSGPGGPGVNQTLSCAVQRRLAIVTTQAHVSNMVRQDGLEPPMLVYDNRFTACDVRRYVLLTDVMARKGSLDLQRLYVHSLSRGG